MAQFTKSYDVKINVIFPHITKTMPDKDSQRIQQTTFFKYEPQKVLPQSTVAFQEIIPVEQSNEDKAEEIFQQLEDLQGEFKRAENFAGQGLQGLVYTYDINDPVNESLVIAETAIFGVATGIITYDKYKKLLNLISVVDEMILDATIQNGGNLNVAS